MNGTERNGTERHVYDFIYDWLTDEGLFIFWMVILNFTSSSVTYGFFSEGINPMLNELRILIRDMLIVLFSVIVLSLLIYLFAKKHNILRRIIHYVFLSVSICMFAADIFAVYHFSMPLNVLMLDIIFMTNLREGSEFLQIYLSEPKFWLFILAAAFVIFVLLYMFRALVRRKLLMLIVFAVISLVSTCAFIREVITGQALGLAKRSIGLFRIADMVSEEYRDRKAYQAVMNANDYDISFSGEDRNIPYIVFILGESTNRHHMQIYGYNLPTNPELDNLLQQGRLYVFTDIVSPHSHTNAVLQKMFTFYRYGSPGEWFRYTSLFSILNAAGYNTAWLSNQEKPSGGSSIKLYSSQCSISKFTDVLRTSYETGVSYDEKLISLLDDALSSEAAKNFFVIHMLGTHFRYSKRYPEKYSVFTADCEEGSTDYQKAVRASYDNAVLYSDFVVSEIIKRFSDKNAAVIYISDHGDEVYDSINFVGHDENIASRYMIEVPMFVWLSDKFREEYPGIEARIALSVNRPYMTDDMIHTLLDLMGIETDEYDPTKSIINSKFDSSRPRIFAGHLYDKENGLHEMR